MAELTQAEVVYSPRSLQVWKALVNWLAFFYQIFLQILRAVGYHHLLSSSSSSSDKAVANGFKPLPVVELPELASESPATVEIASGRTYGERDGHGYGGRFAKLTVVLDLDETLICAYETSSLPVSLRNQAIEGGLKWFELECISSDKECDGKPKINYVTVFERPGLHEFLEQLSQFANLVLFTAGLEGYARPLVDRIDTRNAFSLRLYRPSTVSTQYRDHVKDLSCTSNNMCRTVIVDNNPFSFLLQPLNGIPCIPFSAGQANDTQLLDVILPLLKHLSEQEDIRPILYDRFHMPEWFEKQGISATC
ncbi:PREDICTED: carboxy-terminal domain RNA polymerase II polypeptide A small phosphatase 1 [Tarenaya hassleriana]|uniref:carboxy-terminal domain RNA polymerase II polypeptide A small phosphatase 1 n=1 Tax=Tarenaya hassleriana TaxID=28532 RepID=UPI00053CA4F7|nr:PREDICTED: carboxy-terminal domain RNA polymerase II polypeptide A small phosphatase 1 [Tarenaya hassleriana]XP_010535391.1 PREDICTED: carboxy-terminal domain RNA polymerase II polypeptide A small phosphatase 1 [Tarenaya hassleriana]